MAPLAERLSAELETVRLDLPGFGRSGHPRLRYGPDLFFDAIVELVRHGIDAPVLLIGSGLAAAYATVLPDAFHSDMNFVDDEKAAPIQAADLLIFEWRKSLTYRRTNPAKDDRPWFPKIRAARPGGALVHYDIAQELEELRGVTDLVEPAKPLLTGPVIGRD